jgi:hypothetical protein
LRGVSYPKPFVNLVSSHPDDLIRPVHDDRHRITTLAGDLPVNEEVLKLLLPQQSRRTESVSRAAISDRQRSVPTVQLDNSNRPVARELICRGG